MNRHQVLVVGARCGGAALAMLLARRGHDVVMIDRARFPSDTVSTHALVRGGVVQLQRWGLLPELLDRGAKPIRSVELHRYGGRPVRRLVVKDAAGVDHLLAPRRDLLDDVLVRAAVRAGASLLEATTMTGLRRDSQGRVCGVHVVGGDGRAQDLGASWVVGADGVRSRLAAMAGARVTADHGRTGSAFYAYVDHPDWDGFEFHIVDGLYAGVFPHREGAACVWTVHPRGAGRQLLTAGGQRTAVWRALLEERLPALAERVAQGSITERMRGVVGLPNWMRQAWGPGWALVGDAGYHRDPITGHGITDAFRDAELLSRALSRALREPENAFAHLTEFENVRNRAASEVFELTRSLSAFPAAQRFEELQIELSAVLEQEARWLASGLPADISC